VHGGGGGNRTLPPYCPGEPAFAFPIPALHIYVARANLWIPCLPIANPALTMRVMAHPRHMAKRTSYRCLNQPNHELACQVSLLHGRLLLRAEPKRLRLAPTRGERPRSERPGGSVRFCPANGGHRAGWRGAGPRENPPHPPFGRYDEVIAPAGYGRISAHGRRKTGRELVSRGSTRIWPMTNHR
jgi:hypothetical protein